MTTSQQTNPDHDDQPDEEKVQIITDSETTSSSDDELSDGHTLRSDGGRMDEQDYNRADHKAGIPADSLRVGT